MLAVFAEELIDTKANRGVWDHPFERQEPVSGKTVEDAVESMDRNLEQVVRDAAAQIGRFLACRR